MFFSERLKSSAPESLSGIGHKQIQNHEGTPKLNVLKRTRWPETILAAKFTFHHAACSMLHALVHFSISSIIMKNSLARFQ